MRKRMQLPDVETVEDLQAPPITDDVSRLIYLLEYCRHRGFRVGPLKVGSVMVNVVDLRLAKTEGYENSMPDGPDVWTEHGHVDDSSRE